MTTDLGSPPDTTHLLSALYEQNELLQQILIGLNTSPPDLAVSSALHRISRIADTPVPGASRLLVPRNGYGSFQTLRTGIPTLLTEGRASRLGGRISTNADVSYVILSLGTVEQYNASQALPQIFCTVHQPWNFMLGDVLWAGPVLATAQIGTPDIVVAEV